MDCPVNIFRSLVSYKLPFHISDERLLEDYYKFIALKAYKKDRDGLILSPTAEIDDIWHRHLLYNYDYTKMCTEINYFIFHWPDREKDSDDIKMLRRENFFELCIKFFPVYNKNGDVNDEISQYIFSNLSKDANTQIFVKTLTGKSITIDLDLEKDTLDSLRKRVYLKLGIPLNSHRYAYLGKGLYDETKTLKEYGIEKDCHIHMNLNLKGC